MTEVKLKNPVEAKLSAQAEWLMDELGKEEEARFLEKTQDWSQDKRKRYRDILRYLTVKQLSKALGTLIHFGGSTRKIKEREALYALSCFHCLCSCGKFIRIKETKRCSACRKIRYCSVSCQKNDWPGHKIDCRHFIQEQKQMIMRKGTDEARNFATSLEIWNNTRWDDIRWNDICRTNVSGLSRSEALRRHTFATTAKYLADDANIQKAKNKPKELYALVGAKIAQLESNIA